MHVTKERQYLSLSLVPPLVSQLTSTHRQSLDRVTPFHARGLHLRTGKRIPCMEYGVWHHSRTRSIQTIEHDGETASQIRIFLNTRGDRIWILITSRLYE